MASIRQRPDGTWRARYRDESGKEHSKHFKRKVDGQSWLDQVTAAVVTGQYVNPKAGRITVASYARTWEAAQIGRPATLAVIDNALRVHIVPALGGRQMASVRPSDIQGFIKRLTGKYAAGSVRNIYDTLARMFSAAVNDRVIALTPCRNIRLPRMDDGEINPPTVEEVTEVISAMPDRYRAAAILLAGSGLRIGELFGLQVSDVKFLERTVRVERQRLQNGEIAKAKTAKSVRTVPLSQVVLDALAAHLAEYPSDDALFVDAEGQPLDYPGWQRVWRPARTKAKTEMNTHDFRHFYASALIAGGASVKAVQTVLGHQSAVVTLRTYAHLWPGDEDRTRAVIETTLNFLRTSRGLDQPDDGPTAGQMG
jgi:integrase